MFACKHDLVGPALAGRAVFLAKDISECPDALPAKAERRPAGPTE